jgi:OPT oligopeptide transporter protein
LGKYYFKSSWLCLRSYRRRVRALGETDLNPVSGLGKISQLLFAWILPGNVVANIIAGGVAEAGAQQ